MDWSIIGFIWARLFKTNWLPILLWVLRRLWVFPSGPRIWFHFSLPALIQRMFSLNITVRLLETEQLCDESGKVHWKSTTLAGHLDHFTPTKSRTSSSSTQGLMSHTVDLDVKTKRLLAFGVHFIYKEQDKTSPGSSRRSGDVSKKFLGFIWRLKQGNARLPRFLTNSWTNLICTEGITGEVSWWPLMVFRSHILSIKSSNQIHERTLDFFSK